MKMIRIMFAAILMLFVHAQAEGQSEQKKYTVQLITPTLWAKWPDRLACNLTNVDRRAHVVQVRIISNGTVLFESGEVSLEPKHTTNHYVDGLDPGGPIYCEFTVEGAKDMYRGAAKLFPSPTGTDITAIAAQ